MTKSVALAAVLLIANFASAEADYLLECPSKEVDRAIRDCTIVIGSRSANPVAAYEARCVAHWLKGAYARATADCDQAIRLGVSSPAAYLISGNALAERGDHSGAAADYSRSLELTPTTSAYYNRGTAHLALGEYTLALADFNSAVAGQPSVPQARVNRALALLAIGGSQEEIRADLDRGVELLHANLTASAIRKQVLDILDRRAGSVSDTASAAAMPPLRPFPPSKVLPSSISLEALPATTLTASLATLHARALTLPQPLRGALGRTHAGGGPGHTDSLGDCVRLWNPETRMTQRQWKEICQRLSWF